MSCKRCGSERVMSVFGKCSDMCVVELDGKDHEGYVPHGLEIGGGDDIQFDICIKCGQHQGNFPIEQEKLDEVFGVDEEE